MTDAKHRREFRPKRKLNEPTATKCQWKLLRRKQTCWWLCKRKEKDSELKEEQGHLFVPSCVPKSLTEAILNDIGESLQSEQLWGARGRRKTREQREMRRLLHWEKMWKKVHHRSPMSHAVMLVLCAWLCVLYVSVSLIVIIIRRTPLSLFTPPPPHDSPCLVCACWPSSGRWARL